jgi:hypothetical protein
VREPRSLRGARDGRLLKRLAVALGEPDLLDALGLSSDPRIYSLRGRRFDPACRHHSFASLAEDAGLWSPDVFDLLTKGCLMEATARMAQHVPQVAEQVARDALSHEEPCGRCAATGTAGENQQACPACGGKGTRHVPGDPPARRLLFDAVGLTGKRAPPVAQ